MVNLKELAKYETTLILDFRLLLEVIISCYSNTIHPRDIP